jgi:dipeptidase D
MAAEGLELFTEGDLIGARGTSLGGDDGAAVAIALALLDDPALPRPRLEAVFTVGEETGMDGAKALDVSPLRGRTMLNLDSEDEGVFTVACAGGAHVALRRAAARETREARMLHLGVEGLLGGHSGTEIDKGRANANLLLGRLLDALRQAASFRLYSAAGGTAENAIPNACTAELIAAEADVMPLLDAADRLCAAVRREFAEADPGIRLRCETGPAVAAEALSAEETARFTDALLAAPNGVQAMSAALPGLVETSLNLGLLSLDEGGWTLTFSVRSSAPDGKPRLIETLRALAASAGAEVTVRGDYPAWVYRADSPLRQRMLGIYRRMFGAEPTVTAIHAGLECGILAEKLPGLDCVSIGPDITDIHTPAERLHIASTQRTWEFVKEILKESR